MTVAVPTLLPSWRGIQALPVWAATLPEAPNPRLLQHDGSWWWATTGTCHRGSFLCCCCDKCLCAWGLEWGGPPQAAQVLCRSAVLATCDAPARCILTEPFPASCRALNLALQLIYLHALTDRHHSFNKLIEPPCLPNLAPIPASLALAWHGVYARALPCKNATLPNAVRGKQTVCIYPFIPQNWCVSAMERHCGSWKCSHGPSAEEQFFICSSNYSGWWPNCTENVVKFMMCTWSRALQPRSLCPSSPAREQFMECEEK